MKKEEHYFMVQKFLNQHNPHRTDAERAAWVELKNLIEQVATGFVPEEKDITARYRQLLIETLFKSGHAVCARAKPTPDNPESIKWASLELGNPNYKFMWSSMDYELEENIKDEDML